MFNTDFDSMSLDELAAAWNQLGRQLAERGEEPLRQALECAFAVVVDRENASPREAAMIDRFMADVQLIIDHGGSQLLHAAVQCQLPESVLTLAAMTDEISLHELCRRMFASALLVNEVADVHLNAMYGDAPVDPDEYAPGLSIQYEDFNPDLQSGIGALHRAASELVRRGPTLATTTRLWEARLRVAHAFRPLSFESVGLICWTARRALRPRAP